MSLPDTMLALTLRQSGRVASPEPRTPGPEPLAPLLCAQRIAVPRPGPGQVVIRVSLAAVNPSDRHFVRGEYGQSRVAGTPAGFEGTGSVVAAGSGLMARALVGKRVSFYVDPQGSGSWAEYACARAEHCIPMAEGVRDEDAAGFVVNPLTAAAMFDLVRRSGSQSFVLNAAGSQLGKLLISLAADRGCRPIALVRREATMESLRALGAAHVFCTSDPDIAHQLARRFTVENTLVFLDAVVDPMSAVTFSAMPARARWVIYGMLTDGEPASLAGAPGLIFQGKRIEGFWLTEWHTDVSAVVPLGDAIDSLPAALDQAEGKVLLRPGDV